MEFTFKGEQWELERFCRVIAFASQPAKEEPKEFVRPPYSATTYEFPAGTCAKVKAGSFDKAVALLEDFVLIFPRDAENLVAHIRSLP